MCRTIFCISLWRDCTHEQYINRPSNWTSSPIGVNTHAFCGSGNVKQWITLYFVDKHMLTVLCVVWSPCWNCKYVSGATCLLSFLAPRRNIDEWMLEIDGRIVMEPHPLTFLALRWCYNMHSYVILYRCICNMTSIYMRWQHAHFLTKCIFVCTFISINYN